jgi:hypothetical protein
VPAEADLFSPEVFFSFQNSKAVVFNIGVIFHEVFDVIEVLVGFIEAIVIRVRFGRALEFAQEIPILYEFFRGGIMSTLLPLLLYLLIEGIFFASAVYFLFQLHEIVDLAF